MQIDSKNLLFCSFCGLYIVIRVVMYLQDLCFAGCEILSPDQLSDYYHRHGDLYNIHA